MTFLGNNTVGMRRDECVMHIYCLFCQTQKTDQITNIIESATTFQCIRPKLVQRYWKKGVEEHRIHDYLPGYIFVYSEEPIHHFYEVMRFDGVIRKLGDSENGYELTGADRAFAEMLYHLNGTIGIMKTYKIGDRVQLAEDLYHGFQGEIVKLDKRKGRAQIRFIFDGNEQNVWVGYDLIQPQIRRQEPPHPSE